MLQVKEKIRYVNESRADCKSDPWSKEQKREETIVHWS